MESYIEQLIKRIEFLEGLLDVNAATLEKALSTNRKLIEELKKRAN